MFSCERCSKEFKTNWELQRHIRKKNPCDEVDPVDIEGRCEYCYKSFSSNQKLNSHIHKCQEKDDAVRCLEMQLGIPLQCEIFKTECRFCQYSGKACNVKRHLITCKAKQRYRETLSKQVQESKQGASTSSIINNTNCNNVVNNNIVNNIINVNSLGEEDLSYLTCEVIKGILKDTSSDQEFVAKTLAYIHAHEDHPENHNIVFSNYRSNSALVKLKNKFEFKNINVILKRAVTNWLDNVVFDDAFGKLSKRIIKKYEELCVDDELDQTTKSMFKLALYNEHKNGTIRPPALA